MAVGIAKRPVVQFQQRVDGIQVQVRRNPAVPQHEDGLDQSGNARRAFQVPDVGFDGADHKRTIGRAPGAQHDAEGLDFDRVAQARAGAVGLDVADVAGRQTRVGQGGADHGFLGGAVGGRQAVAPPIVVHGGAADRGDDPIAVRPRRR